MSDIAAAARKLYNRRDKIARELAEIDQQLNRLRADYMRENTTFGIHPTAFRRVVETTNKKRAA